MRLPLVVILLLLVSPISAAAAAAGHAIAMHGDPKYPSGFRHFDYVQPSAPKGGRLVMARAGAFDSLNPFIIRGNAADGRTLVFETLMTRGLDEPFTLYGLLAESVEVPEDRSWVIFRLRPEARFHDGRPVTVDDVIFSLETLRDHGRPNHHTYYSQVSRIERVGARGVKFTFASAKDRELPLILGLLPVLPRHWFKGRDFEQVSLDVIPGTGPYRVQTVDPGRAIVYRRDPAYWGRDLAVNRGKFNFDTVRYEYFRDDDMALEAFKAGAIDFRDEPSPRKWATGYDSKALRDGRIIRAVLPNGRPAGLNALVFNTRKNVFRDARVRRALIDAFDFEWMNQKLFYGAYTRTQGIFDNSELAAPLAPGADERALAAELGAARHPALSRPLALLPQSDGKDSGRQHLRRAKQTFDALGYTVRDGRLLNPAGEPVAFEILLDDPSNMRVAQQYARDLSRLGVHAEPRLVDNAQYQQRLTTYDFDMIVYFWGQSLSPGNEQSFYWGAASADQPGTRNYMGVRDPVIDKLIGRITGAKTRAELVTATRLLDRVFRAGAYVLPLYHLRGDRVAYWNRIAMPPVPPLTGYSPETWWATGN
ncbi:extracellular solute-binding protein [Iodidimonas sp. SYSU 1G8]|uniref:extracellular solute-binding protein n=1 Tax=Iodidimonas sp. SYSU 1G8 TaxID=3133967 RepID=UPI0031FE7311